MGTEKFKQDQLSLNLQKNSEVCLNEFTCVGHQTQYYQIRIQDAHALTLHRRVALNYHDVHQTRLLDTSPETFNKEGNSWCFGCKRFQAPAFQYPQPGNLPVERTTGSVPFQVMGVDYAGPISNKASSKRETGKAYILLFACSLTRAIHLELLSDQTTEVFINSFKQFIARRGRRQKVYSDNGRSFVATARWLRGIMKDERMSRLPIQKSYHLAV